MIYFFGGFKKFLDFELFTEAVETFQIHISNWIFDRFTRICERRNISRAFFCTQHVIACSYSLTCRLEDAIAPLRNSRPLFPQPITFGGCHNGVGIGLCSRVAILELVGMWRFVRSVLKDQSAALKIFWRPEMRIPVLLIWIASFGSSLHDPVTIFFYLKVVQSALNALCKHAQDMPTFSLRQIGASAKQIGNLYTISTLGTIILAPAYGYLIDKMPERGAIHAIRISCVLCAMGCLLRSMATEINGLYVVSPNLWSMFFNTFSFSTLHLVCAHEHSYIGVAIMGLGDNLWTLVLTYISACCPNDIRSIVVSAYLMQVCSDAFLAILPNPAREWWCLPPLPSHAENGPPPRGQTAL